METSLAHNETEDGGWAMPDLLFNFSGVPSQRPPAEEVQLRYTPSEKAEMLFYSLIFAVGVPLNLGALYRNYQWSGGGRGRQGWDLRLFLLSLNLSDLLVLLVYVPSQLAWRATISWGWGWGSCKTIRFVHQLAFHLCSYNICSVATARWLGIWHRRRPDYQLPTRGLLAAVWLGAIVASLPTLGIWTLYRPFPSRHPAFQQCTTRFIIAEYGGGGGVFADADLRLLLDLSGILSVFWLPLLYISIAYGYVFVCLLKMGRDRSFRRERAGPKRPPSPAALSATVGGSQRHSFSVSLALPSPKLGRENGSCAISPSGRTEAASPTSPSRKRTAPPALNLKRNCASFTQMPSESQQCLQPRSVSEVCRKAPKEYDGPKWRKSLRSKRHLWNQTGILVVLYLCCWLPYFAGAWNPRLGTLSVLIALQTAVDPLIYAW